MSEVKWEKLANTWMDLEKERARMKMKISSKLHGIKYVNYLRKQLGS